MKILHTFLIPITYQLNGVQIDEALRLLNLHYTGDEDCNHEVDGKLVGKYPDIEKNVPEFKESHYNVYRGYRGTLQVNLMEDGTLRIV